MDDEYSFQSKMSNMEGMQRRPSICPISCKEKYDGEETDTFAANEKAELQFML